MTPRLCKRVYTEEEVLNSTGNDYFLNFTKGYDVTQNGDLIILDKPGISNIKVQVLHTVQHTYP
jgi:hypothetical protein